ncbi:MAG: hypothetical protein ABS934_04770 [Psychrobacillus sp.]
MKKWLVLFLVISLCVNVLLFGNIFWKGMYTPNERDQVILGEMVQLVISSPKFKSIDDSEGVLAVNQMVDRNKGGVFPYHYDVIVYTSEQAYIFGCKDDKCDVVGLEGTMYSRYKDSELLLPFK